MLLKSIFKILEFTTLTCIPGVIEYKGANIQLLDLPGIIEGASQGKGRGRQVIAVARTADLVVMMLDATKPNVHRDLLEKELESVGIRLNKQKPNIYFKQKKGGGLSFNSTCPVTRCNEKMVQTILHSFKIFNAEVQSTSISLIPNQFRNSNSKLHNITRCSCVRTAQRTSSSM